MSDELVPGPSWGDITAEGTGWRSLQGKRAIRVWGDFTSQDGHDEGAQVAQLRVAIDIPTPHCGFEGRPSVGTHSSTLSPWESSSLSIMAPGRGGHSPPVTHPSLRSHSRGEGGGVGSWCVTSWLRPTVTQVLGVVFSVILGMEPCHALPCHTRGHP